jgi:glycosyltransferase involved in cell wall biosynthesis
MGSFRRLKRGRMQLSAVVITRNEEANIERCLKSLAFCDDIVVVDSCSTDNTVEIARKFTSNVVTRPWSGYAEQKNYANSLAKHDWILSIDADEEVSPELQNEIKQLLNSSPELHAYHMPRKTIHFGQWIRYGGWYPNRLVRLFRKSKGTWSDKELHEAWVTEGNAGSLTSDLIHYSFDGISDQVERNNHYSTLGAVKLRREGRNFSTLRLLTKSASKFFETYFLKFGFLDGYPGFIISVSAAYSVFLKWAKLWELENERADANA